MKDKTTAFLLAWFLGGIGVHKFYLGQNGVGIIYVLFCWTFIPAFLAFFEGLGYLFQDTHTFNQRYNNQVAGYLPQPSPQQMAQNITVNIPPGQDTRQLTGPGACNITDELHKLNELRIAGVLTEAEFAREKQRLLSS